MQYGFLRYTSYLVLVFGFLYMSWHLGRSFESDGGTDVSVTISSCWFWGYSFDCCWVEVGLGDFIHVYDRMTDEPDGVVPVAADAQPRLELTKR